ncbi:MAG: hypothetical protein JST54_33235 [Deltaproteobacteria bacterium]|nr:hypothetical protein [Deltaproteobacteria bacterium]
MASWLELGLGLLAVGGLWGLAMWLASDEPRGDAKAQARADALSRDIESTLVALHEKR